MGGGGFDTNIQAFKWVTTYSLLQPVSLGSFLQKEQKIDATLVILQMQQEISDVL